MITEQAQNEPITIGIHGAIRHGKTTFAEALQMAEPNSLYYESSTIISEVLDRAHEEMTEPFSDDRVTLINELLSKLPPILKEVVHVDTEVKQLLFTEADAINNLDMHKKLLEHAVRLQQMPGLAKQRVTPENKEYYRAGLQGIGGYLVAKVSNTIWYDEIIRRSKADATDATKLVVVGGLRYPADAEVVRGNHGFIVEVVRPFAPETDTTDPTEFYRKQIKSHSKIINNGDIDDMHAIGKIFYDDLQTGIIKPVYIASTSSADA